MLMQAELEWCERRLLARIHRLTINRLRSEIQAVSIQDYPSVFTSIGSTHPRASALAGTGGFDCHH